MNQDLYVRRRSRRAEMGPGLLWFSLTFLLLAILGVGYLVVHAFMADWLDLKLESARVHVLEALPKPDNPEFVPTPILVAHNSIAPTIVWQQETAQPQVSLSAEPNIALATAAAQNTETAQQAIPLITTPQPTPIPIIADTSGLNAIRPAVQLTGVIQEAQRFNNCGPTTLRMYFSYFGYRQDSQVQIADVIKPYKDDRNVSPNELTAYAQSKGFKALTRVNGTLDRLKEILSNDLPVMIEEGYDPPRAHEGWMGHYILLTGYDDQGIIAQDSYNGPNQHVAWADVDSFWRDFNRTYIVMYKSDQEQKIRALLGQDMDDATMYARAAQRAQDEWNANPKDAFAAFNLGSSLVGLHEYDAAANAFDRARVLNLPWRMLWYQFGPYEAYYNVGRYDEIVALADATLKPTGDLEESYYYKGLALQKLGRTDQARQAFQLALKYNPNYLAAQQALAELGS